jgi:8-oxo-dGTP diphosphatase
MVGVGVFVKRDGKYLLGKRKGSHGAGEWSLPGGHLEFGESFWDCCIREVQEETGLKILELKSLTFTNNTFTKENLHYVTLFFTSCSYTGEALNIEPDKCEGWQWFSPEDFPKPLFGGIVQAMNYLPELKQLYI